MKRLIITLLIITMLGVIFPGLPTIAQPHQLPHENPETTTSSLDEVGLLLSYSDIIDLATDSQYRDAQDILSELEHADIPDEIRYIITQYSNLFQSLFGTLDDIEAILDQASESLSENDIGEVEQLLDRAITETDNAYILLEDVETATSILTDMLGVFAVTATSQLTQAYTRLEGSLDRLADLISRFNILNEDLNKQYVQKTRLSPTRLNLSIDPPSDYVGEFITVSGRLTCNDSPVNEGRIAVYIDNKKVATAFSGTDGTYITSTTIPYIYNKEITFIAEYEPSGEQAIQYLASSSSPVIFNNQFYSTLLEVSSHIRLYRGLPFTVIGEVNSNNDDIIRSVAVLLNDNKLAEQTTSGPFSFEIMPPVTLPTGPGTLTVEVRPLGRYSGAIEHQNVTVSRLPINFNIHTPSIVLLPGEIQISGSIFSQLGPVKNAPVSCNFRKSSTTVKTSEDGSFNAFLKAPLDFLLVGPQEITIEVTPQESWAATNTISRRIFTVNPLNTGLVLIILLALWFIIRRRNLLQKDAEEQVLPQETIEIPIVTPSRKPEPVPQSVKGQIIMAYQGTLAIIEKITGVIMSPDITLREFLETVRLPSQTASDNFTELTTMTEATLYSASRPGKDTASRAHELAVIIVEELSGGTS